MMYSGDPAFAGSSVCPVIFAATAADSNKNKHTLTLRRIFTLSPVTTPSLALHLSILLNYGHRRTLENRAAAPASFIRSLTDAHPYQIFLQVFERRSSGANKSQLLLMQWRLKVATIKSGGCNACWTPRCC